MKLMYRLILVSLFFLPFCKLSAQDKMDTVPPIFWADSLNTVYIFADSGTTINKIDAQGRKQGLWKKFYADGKLRYKGHFLDNKPVGVFKNYYNNDSIQSIRVFSDDGMVARTHMFYPTGAILGEGKTLNEKRDSIWKEYDEWQRLIVKEQFKNGKRDGKKVVFYTNGNVAEIVTFKNDKENGPWQQFYYDGVLKLDAKYVNGEVTDTMYLYSPDGTKHIKGNYLHDMKEGKWVFYDAGGSPKDTAEYHRGKLLHPEKYSISKAQEDSLKIQYQPLQQQLDHPGSLDEEYEMGGQGQ